MFHVPFSTTFHVPFLAMFHVPFPTMFHQLPCSIFQVLYSHVPSSGRTPHSGQHPACSSILVSCSTFHVPRAFSSLRLLSYSTFQFKSGRRVHDNVTPLPFPATHPCPRVRQVRPDSSWTSCLSLIPAHSCSASCCQHDTPPQPSTYRGKLCQVPHL